ncbi:hypothetical protein AMTR_s00049p00183950 [Amborella trichopoda]|uniref:Uncharacterized protein n=1 Tax=Amborella trichopoda TaxID=13333 RepID=W1Q065_AMBTC|nr:hypothetical protein AMTR_s00049p00183950 [Amborella trichopoda]
MGDFFEELSAIVERSMQLYYSNRGLVWRTWTEEVDNHDLLASLIENPSTIALTSHKKEEIALKSNDEEEEIAGESDELSGWLTKVRVHYV